MSRPRLYGIPGSRALRSIWGIEEVGIDYELVPTSFVGDVRTPEYREINPNGRIPALVDGELKLFESMAINLYLARTYGGALYPADEPDQARAWQWSVWAISELEPNLMDMVLHKVMLPPERRRPEAVVDAEKAIRRPLHVLEAHLAERAYLLGDAFTVADLNVAAVLALKDMMGFEGVAAFERVSAWYRACTARPSFARAQRAGES